MSSWLFTRRALLGASSAGLFISAAVSEETAPANLTYRGGRLKWPGGETRAAIGKAGVTVKKREGDHATPAGDFPLLEALYRDDRVNAPKAALPIRALKEGVHGSMTPAIPNTTALSACPIRLTSSGCGGRTKSTTF